MNILYKLNLQNYKNIVLVKNIINGLYKMHKR